MQNGQQASSQTSLMKPLLKPRTSYKKFKKWRKEKKRKKKKKKKRPSPQKKSPKEQKLLKEKGIINYDI